MKHISTITKQRTPATAASLLVWQQLITVLASAAAAFAAWTNALDGLFKGGE